MPISINNPDSMDFEDNSWLNEPILKTHFKSFSEIFYDNCENQSVRDKIAFMSLENEGIYNREALQSDRNIRKFGYAQYRYANELDDQILHTNALDSNYHLKDKTDGTCGDSQYSSYMIKNQNEDKIRASIKYPNYSIGELVVSKLRFKKAIELEKLIYKVGDLKPDYKPNQFNDHNTSIHSCHLHISASNLNSQRKMTSKNGYRFLQDIKDRITAQLKLNKNHNAYYRFLGYNTWCKLGFNTPDQRRGGDRYFDMNDCLNVRSSHGHGQRLKTLEFRAFTFFREMELTLEALRIYNNSWNKFLKFYEDISPETMEQEDLYFRIDNKMHRNKILVIPNFSDHNGFFNNGNDRIRENNGLSLSEIRDQYIRGND